jgi:hypothetical protein
MTGKYGLVGDRSCPRKLGKHDRAGRRAVFAVDGVRMAAPRSSAHAPPCLIS